MAAMYGQNRPPLTFRKFFLFINAEPSANSVVKKITDLLLHNAGQAGFIHEPDSLFPLLSGKVRDAGFIP
jgi:hypothetical protein